MQVTNKWAMELPVSVPAPSLPTPWAEEKPLPSGISVLEFMLISLCLIFS